MWHWISIREYFLRQHAVIVIEIRLDRWRFTLSFGYQRVSRPSVVIAAASELPRLALASVLKSFSVLSWPNPLLYHNKENALFF